MKKKIFIFMISAVMLCSCGKEESMNYDSTLSLNEQTLEQLQLETPVKTLNYENQKAVWFTMMDYKDVLYNRSKEEFTDNMEDILKKIKDTGFNTVYLHVRPYNDAYYNSEILPPAQYMGDFDPLDITLEKAHDLKLSVHAWINPLRCQTDDELKKLDEKYIIKQWYNQKKYISEVNGRWYLNPAYEEVWEYIADGVREIAENYNVDAIHIDDYFYPDDDTDFDKKEFEESGEDDLSNWRINNINLMVEKIYKTIKNINKNLLFGISPQGNIDIDYSNQYADVKRWCGGGYCDYIVPQIYYGFKNETMPFENTVCEWKNLVDHDKVNLVIGICTYKIGMEDKWAGSGKNEWIDDKNIPSREIEFAADNECGVAVYSMDSLFDEKNSEECSMISHALSD